MKKILLSFFFLSFLSINAHDTSSVEDGLLSINFLTPGLEDEFGFTNSTTLDIRAGTCFAYRKSSFGGGYESFGVHPIFNVQYRYYYNLEKRIYNDKNISNNSGNFIALSGVVQLGKPIIGNMENNEAYFGAIGPVWGLLRFCISGFKLDLNLGGGYDFNESGGSFFSPLIGLR